MKDHKNSFDIIITDSSDPVGKNIFDIDFIYSNFNVCFFLFFSFLFFSLGPAESLFQKEFFALMKDSLRPSGIICTQGECPWLHMNIIKDVIGFCKQLFSVVEFATISIPTYPCGQIGFVVCSTSVDVNPKKPLRLI